jgi:hypothetical protein
MDKTVVDRISRFVDISAIFDYTTDAIRREVVRSAFGSRDRFVEQEILRSASGGYAQDD